MASTYMPPMYSSESWLLTKYASLDSHSYRLYTSSPMVTTPATGTTGTPSSLTLLAGEAAHRSGLRSGRMTTAIALNRYVTAMTSVASSVYDANVELYEYSAPNPTAGSSISTSEATGTRRFSETCAAASGSTRSNAAAKMTRVEDRNSVPTQPKNHRLNSRIRMTWNAELCTSQAAISTGYGKIGSTALATRFWPALTFM